MKSAVGRRTVIAAGGVALAGCLDGGGGEPSDADDGGVEYEGPRVGETELLANVPLSFEDPDEGERVADVHYHGDGEAHWHFQPLTVPLGETRRLVIRLRDAGGDLLPLTGEKEFDVAPAALEADAPVSIDVEGDELFLTGDAAGETDVRFEVRGPEDGNWTTPPLRVRVEE